MTTLDPRLSVDDLRVQLRERYGTDDLYTGVVCHALGVTPEQVTPRQRLCVKDQLFLWTYGATPSPLPWDLVVVALASLKEP